MDLQLWYGYARDTMGIDFLNNPDTTLLSEVICQCAYADRSYWQGYLEDAIQETYYLDLLTDFLHNPNNHLRSQAFTAAINRKIWNEIRDYIDENIWEMIEEAAYLQAEEEQLRHEDQLYEEYRERELYESSD